MTTRRSHERAREVFAGRDASSLTDAEIAASWAAGYEPGNDGRLVGRSDMTPAEQQAAGRVPMSTTTAIRAKCLDCCAGAPSEVRPETSSEQAIIAVRRFRPPFVIGWSGVGVIDGDFAAGDVRNVLGVPRIHAAATQLRRAAPDLPTLAYITDSGSPTALAANFRLAGFRAEHVIDDESVEVIRGKVADLTSRRLDVLVSCGRLAGLRPIPGLQAVLLVAPTLSSPKHQRYLGRLDPSAGELVIIDIVDSCGRHGLPAGWIETVTVGPVTEIIRDGMIERLTAVPNKQALQWAGQNPERLELIQRAKGFKPGWVYNAVKSFDPAAADRWWAARGKSS